MFIPVKYILIPTISALIYFNLVFKLPFFFADLKLLQTLDFAFIFVNFNTTITFIEKACEFNCMYIQYIYSRNTK